MRWARDPPVLALQWLDNKVVSMTSTSANANDKVQPIRKAKVGGVWDPDRRVDQPQVIHDYNHFVNTVDRSNQVVATHSVRRRSMRWWKAVLFDAIDTAVVNSFILFTEHRRKFPDNFSAQQSII